MVYEKSHDIYLFRVNGNCRGFTLYIKIYSGKMSTSRTPFTKLVPVYLVLPVSVVTSNSQRKSRVCVLKGRYDQQYVNGRMVSLKSHLSKDSWTIFYNHVSVQPRQEPVVGVGRITGVRD